jgi:hypothetical protein
MKTRTVILVGVGLVLLAVAAAPYLVHHSVQSRIGPQHIFELSESPSFLTEEMALTKARDTLTRDGIDLAIWQLQRDGRTSAPDGRLDEFAARNTINSNRVVFAFTNGSASTHFVSVELAGSRVICQSSIGK